MKTTSVIRPKLRRAGAWIACFSIVIALCAGCVSTTEIKSIVEDSNAALFAAQLPDSDLAGDPAATKTLVDPAAVTRKIDEFIAAHPDQKVTNSALRVRQAILFIAHGKYELARAAFADATDLKTDRDKALKSVSESIIWWWEHAGEDRWSEPVRDKARDHLAAIDSEIARVRQSPGIRDYLEELRARIGFQLARNLQASQGKRDVFIDAMNRYGASLSAADVSAIESNALTPQSPAFSDDDRRRLRALGVIEKAKVPAGSLSAASQPVAVADLDPAARPFGELVLDP